MDEGFPDERWTPSQAQRDSRTCLRDGVPQTSRVVGDLHSLPMRAHTNNAHTAIAPNLLSAVSRLSSSSSQLSRGLSPTRRLSPTRVVISEPVWKEGGETTAQPGTRPVVSGTTLLGGSLRVGPTGSNNRQVPPASLASKSVNVPIQPNFENQRLSERGSLRVGNAAGDDGQVSSASLASKSANVPIQPNFESQRLSERGSLRIGDAAGNDGQVSSASLASTSASIPIQPNFENQMLSERGSLRVGPPAGTNRQVSLPSRATKTISVSTQPNFEGPGLYESKLHEIPSHEMDSQIESMLASARKDLLAAEVGDGSDVAPKQQKTLGVEEAIRAALEVVGQDRHARAREISDLQIKITSQQEWFAKELSRQTIKSAEALASTDRLEKQVEAMRNQMFQPGEPTSRERAQGEAHEISQAHAHSESINSHVQEAMLSSPESAQYVQKLVDDRIQHVLDTQLSAKFFASTHSLSQHVQTLVDDRVQKLVDAQFGAESTQEHFNAPFTLAFVQKAIFSSSCLSQHVRTLVSVQVQQMIDATHELKQELHAFTVRLQEEREMRAKSIHDLHSKLASETASIRAHVEKTNLCLQEARTTDKLSQTQEFAEFRAMLDAVWARASRVKDSDSSSDFFKYVDEGGSVRYKECVGDAEDINTLYQMVREAVGDNEMLKRDIANGKDKQHRDQAKLQRQVEHLEGRLLKLQNGLPEAGSLTKRVH